MKTLLFVLISVLVSGTLVMAEQVDLSEHGPDLLKAPFAARYRFENAYHKDWPKSSYVERKEFLTNWHMQIREDQKKQKIEQRKEKLLEKEKQQIKKEALIKERNRIKKNNQEAKDEHKEYITRGKSLDKKVSEQARRIRQMEKSGRN